MREKGKWFWKSQWYSICSKHYEYDENCNMCKHGSWVKDYNHMFSSLIFSFYPNLWKFYHNYDAYMSNYFKHFKKNSI